MPSQCLGSRWRLHQLRLYVAVRRLVTRLLQKHGRPVMPVVRETRCVMLALSGRDDHMRESETATQYLPLSVPWLARTLARRERDRWTSPSVPPQLYSTASYTASIRLLRVDLWTFNASSTLLSYI